MSNSLDKQYAQIARACLAALNNVNPAADRSAQIQELYDAIDNSIGDLYKYQEESLGRCYSTLKAIAELDPAENQLSDAIQLAKDALPPSH